MQSDALIHHKIINMQPCSWQMGADVVAAEPWFICLVGYLAPNLRRSSTSTLTDEDSGPDALKSGVPQYCCVMRELFPSGASPLSGIKAIMTHWPHRRSFLCVCFFVCFFLNCGLLPSLTLSPSDGKTAQTQPALSGQHQLVFWSVLRPMMAVRHQTRAPPLSHTPSLLLLESQRRRSFMS